MMKTQEFNPCAYKNFDQESLDAALVGACQHNDIQLVRFLLTSPDLLHHPDIHTQDDNPLHWACYNGNLELARFLLTSPDIVASGGEHANLHANDDWALRTACTGGRLNIVRYLLESPDLAEKRHANIHAGGDTAFLWACQYGHVALVDYLLGKLNVSDKEDFCLKTLCTKALVLVAQEGHWETVKLLLTSPQISSQDRPDLSHQDYEAFKFAAWKGHLTTVKTILDYPMLDKKDLAQALNDDFFDLLYNAATYDKAIESVLMFLLQDSDLCMDSELQHSLFCKAMEKAHAPSLRHFFHLPEMLNEIGEHRLVACIDRSTIKELYKRIYDEKVSETLLFLAQDASPHMAGSVKKAFFRQACNSYDPQVARLLCAKQGNKYYRSLVTEKMLLATVDNFKLYPNERAYRDLLIFYIMDCEFPLKPSISQAIEGYQEIEKLFEARSLQKSLPVKLSCPSKKKIKI